MTKGNNSDIVHITFRLDRTNGFMVDSFDVIRRSNWSNRGLTHLKGPNTDATANTDLIKTLLTPYVTQEIERYYAKILKSPPTFAPYFGMKLKVNRTEPGNHKFIVTVHAVPYVGPHIAVGEDEITFDIKPCGQVETISYIHLKDYKLPSHMQHYYR